MKSDFSIWDWGHLALAALGSVEVRSRREVATIVQAGNRRVPSSPSSNN